MRMTQNHVYTKIIDAPVVARWLHPDLIDVDRIVVAWVRPGSYADRAGFNTGACVSEMNGHEVHNLDDVRKYFVPDGLAQQAPPSRLARFGRGSLDLAPDADKVVWSIRTDLGYVY